MSDIAPARSFVADLASPLPPTVVDRVERADAAMAAVRFDGLLAITNATMLRRLGFHEGDDLRGLPVASMWHHQERPAVLSALRRAQRDGRATLELDLGYITDAPAPCEMTFEAVEGRVLLATLDC